MTIGHKVASPPYPRGDQIARVSTHRRGGQLVERRVFQRRGDVVGERGRIRDAGARFEVAVLDPRLRVVGQRQRVGLAPGDRGGIADSGSGPDDVADPQAALQDSGHAVGLVLSGPAFEVGPEVISDSRPPQGPAALQPGNRPPTSPGATTRP